MNGAAEEPGLIRDSWEQLRAFTAARIAMGRAGGSLPTSEWLNFAADHAEARDAVHSEMDVARLEKDLSPLAIAAVNVATQATDRHTYLQRPDLGRLLTAESHSELTRAAAGTSFDISITVADGLSSLATQLNAPAVLEALIPRLRAIPLTIAPLALARQARVALMDEIGASFKAGIGLILIGERPGLKAADSLGAYLVYRPDPGKTDADRNCVSNIRTGGLAPSDAAGTIAYLISQILQKQISGVSLKDERSNSQISLDATLRRLQI